MQKSARGVALDILTSFEVPALRAPSVSQIPDDRDRSLVHEIVNGTLRWRRLIDDHLSGFLKRPFSSLTPRVRNALRMGTYEMLVMGIPPYAAVSSTVECFQRRSERGFVNGVLRAVARNLGHVELPSIDTDPGLYASVRYSYPEWMVRRLISMLGVEDALSFLKAGNTPPPLTLRVNTAATTRDGFLEVLRKQGYTAEAGSLDISIKVHKGRRVEDFPGYDQGYFTVQDEGAMLVTFALEPRPGDYVWDMCAAPGGKTTHIAEVLAGNGRVVATDIDDERARMIEGSVRRLRLSNITVFAVDATESQTVRRFLEQRELPTEFDRILLDAPCSGLGTVRRNPDLKWHRRESDIFKMVERQKRLLESAAHFLKPGGTLVYSTCTVTEEENQGVWKWFLETQKDFVPEDPAKSLPLSWKNRRGAGNETRGPGYLYLLPHVHGTDGFFIAKARKMLPGESPAVVSG
ncbi:MAG: 16S rRNA (cytosine(967)-C(5))-methyltransferase RsmB [Candidatus Fermentithermobacillus carboniphilus]|uniref:16S rRNA (cytosine(967)-C(5))-methyltransferase n=1 Tax=Candidatus Fermentithermobacillus carboniphilus TaxID=3085328 RepID=A0AAT9LB65_9FIRM|nr:MAG: 16S rRNA (cytosine(967)-C(5))-methyltransferase RsmB [Candidatus Fermentithermobacillus carboniphilus]